MFMTVEKISDLKNLKLQYLFAFNSGEELTLRANEAEMNAACSQESQKLLKYSFIQIFGGICPDHENKSHKRRGPCDKNAALAVLFTNFRHKMSSKS